MTAAGVGSVAGPATLDELRMLLRWHAAQGHRVTVSGGRTGVVGGAVPDASTHLISVARLRGVVEIDLNATPATVRAFADANGGRGFGGSRFAGSGVACCLEPTGCSDQHLAIAMFRAASASPDLTPSSLLSLISQTNPRTLDPRAREPPTVHHDACISSAIQPARALVRMRRMPRWR